VQEFYDWFRWLYDATGINLNYIYDDFDRARMLKGLWLTLELSFVTIVLSVIIGIIGAWLQGSRLKWLRLAIDGFISLFRNTPPLVQIYFFYFGLGYLLPRTYDPGSGSLEPLLSNVQWAIISLSLFAGAFNIEIFRSGIESVSQSTVEAAESLGFSRWQTYRDVVLPLAFRTCLPALSNNLVNLIKTTNLAYAIAVPELMYTAKQIWADATNVPEMMLTVLVIYVLIATSFAWFMNQLERWLWVPGFGTAPAHA
jgi:polar amino acid transport system permease protein